jgi:hypothetical protein
VKPAGPGCGAAYEAVLVSASRSPAVGTPGGGRH